MDYFLFFLKRCQNVLKIGLCSIFFCKISKDQTTKDESPKSSRKNIFHRLSVEYNHEIFYIYYGSVNWLQYVQKVLLEITNIVSW